MRVASKRWRLGSDSAGLGVAGVGSVGVSEPSVGSEVGAGECETSCDTYRFVSLQLPGFLHRCCCLNSRLVASMLGLSCAVG
jgi:hypothetical protein